MVDDAPVLTFDEPQHQYTLNGKPCRSVTQILRKVGLINFDHVPSYVLDAALARGRAVHKALEYWHQHDLDVVDFRRTFPDWSGFVDSWIRLMTGGRFHTFAAEQRVGNFAPRYCGCYDWLGTHDGHAALLDFSTGNPFDAAKNYQLAGYTLAINAWAHTPGQDKLRTFLDQHSYIHRIAVRLQRDGSLPQLTTYDDPRDFTGFLKIAEAVAIVDDARPRSVPWDWRTDDVSALVNA